MQYSCDTDDNFISGNHLLNSILAVGYSQGSKVMQISSQFFLSLLLYPKRKLQHQGELTFYKCAQKLRGSYLKSKSITETRQVCLKKNYNYVTLTIHFQNQSNKSNEVKNVKKLFLNFEISYLSKILGSFGWKMRPNTLTIQALY